jgi:hypothetical protein
VRFLRRPRQRSTISSISASALTSAQGISTLCLARACASHQIAIADGRGPSYAIELEMESLPLEGPGVPDMRVLDVSAMEPAGVA